MKALVLVAAFALAVPFAVANSNPLTQDCPRGAPDEARACRSVDVVVDGFARVCRNVAGSSACDAVDAEPTASARIDAYLASETHRALHRRFHLGDELPLRLAAFPHTHNSFNAEAYAPTLSGLDPNQRYSIYDQLRMDVRAIELDAHWWPSPGGAAMAPVMCHAEDVGNGVHGGCTTERLLASGLNEIALFLRQDANVDEVILLYIEDHLDGQAGSDAAAAAIAGGLGPWVYRPADSGRACQDGLPLDKTRADVLAAGKRILLVASTCGEGAAWASYAHSYHASIDQHGIEDLTPYPDCGGPSIAYGEKIVRFWEDRTWLTSMAEPQQRMTPEAAREAMRCGVNVIGFDMLDPFDGRLDALVAT